MKKTTKAIVFVVCVLLVFAAMTSCNAKDEKSGDGKGDPAANQENENANRARSADDGLLRDNLPDGLDFGGYEFRVLFHTYGDRSGAYFYPEAEEGEILSDAFYKRNKKIQERFNVAIKATKQEGGGNLSAAVIGKDVLAGADEYDMYMVVDREAQNDASKGYLYPVNQLEYVDLAQLYWLRDVNEILTVGSKLPWAFSEEMLSVFENTLAVFYNKKQAQDLGFEDLYRIVREGGWTFDKFFEYAKAGIKNLGGNDKMTADDCWGIVAGNDEFYANFWIGAGINSVDKDANGMPYFALPGNERFLTMAQLIFDNKSIDGMYWDSHTRKLPLGTGIAAGIDFFRNGHAVFVVATIQEMVNLRDMEDDFGVIPFPKFEKEQPRYYSRISGGRPFVIPTTNQRPDIAGALMEAMACETSNTVYPAYYESSLKNKFSRDPETVEMLDLVRATLMYDLGDTIWFSDVRGPLTNDFNGKTNKIASWIEKNSDKVDKAIAKIVESIMEAY